MVFINILRPIILIIIIFLDLWFLYYIGKERYLYGVKIILKSGDVEVFKVKTTSTCINLSHICKHSRKVEQTWKSVTIKEKGKTIVIPKAAVEKIEIEELKQLQGKGDKNG